MSDPSSPAASVKPASLEDFLRANLNKYIGRIKKLENGGGLHSMVMTTVEKQLVAIVLDETGGNQSQAAHILGLNRNTLRRKVELYKIGADGRSRRKKKKK